MGLFNRLKSKSKKIEQEMANYIEEVSEPVDNGVSDEEALLFHDEARETVNPAEVEDEYVDAKSLEDVDDFIKNTCEKIAESRNEIQTAKVEYAVVSEYLHDIETIETLPEDRRKKIDDCARCIVNLNGERLNFQKFSKSISSKQFKKIEMYESDYPQVIQRIKDKEMYQETIKNDIFLLEGEKEGLLFTREEIKSNQRKLHKLTIFLTIILSVTMLFLVGMHFYYNIDMLIPTMLTVVVGSIFVGTVFIMRRTLLVEQKKTENSLNHAIRLLNKVKIKLINNTTELDYLCEKHSTHSAYELEHLWKQFIKAREQQRRYASSAEDLDYYSNELSEQLKRAEIKDPTVWPSQAVAIIDKREMVEVKHSLIKRRQKLRERMEYNRQMRDGQLRQLQKFVNNHPEHKKRTLNALVIYNIVI